MTLMHGAMTNFGWRRAARWSLTGAARRRRLASRVIARSHELRRLSDDALRTCSRELRWRARCGEPLDALQIDAFALVRDAARRVLGCEHFPVQILGGAALFEGRVAEMQTGEGKTLTATLVAYLRALPGHGCHVVTVNDYLAERDSRTMRPLFELLDLTTGCVLDSMDDAARRAAYSCDIVYAAATQIGFDFLRDRLKGGLANPVLRRRSTLPPGALKSPADALGAGRAVADPSPVQRGLHFALLDEADSILIDEARTPLVIGLDLPQTPAALALLEWAGRAADELRSPGELLVRPERRSVALTDLGRRRVVLRPRPAGPEGFEIERLFEAIERAATARLLFHRDRDYVVAEGAVEIVDESTGRVLEGRKWEQGLHQAIEWKERVPVTPATGAAAQVAVQSLFREYRHVAGMTGTAQSAARELKRTFGLAVSAIPTHRPCRRVGLPPRIFATRAARDAAVADAIEPMRRAGRAVLVGTPSVSASEILSDELSRRGIPHCVLNARRHAEEAEIVAQAGRSGRVTIATNMAGRGTDIGLEDSVRAAGGLHVIATEMHSSARIDRQLIGRAARQGDPGSFQFLLSLEDELFLSLPAPAAERPRAAFGAGGEGELPASAIRLFRRAQRQIERMHAADRRLLLLAERARRDAHRRMGLDPCLELPDR